MLDLTVIVPTCGRDTLARTLDSIPDHVETLVYPNDDEQLGHPQRNQGMAEASGRWLAFMDDDDVYALDAFDAIEDGLTDKPVPHIFQMRYEQDYGFPAGHVLWTDPVLRFGNVGTPMWVLPNIPHRLGEWVPKRGGDFDFISRTVKLMGGEPVWIPHVIALIRPTVTALTPA